MNEHTKFTSLHAKIRGIATAGSAKAFAGVIYRYTSSKHRTAQQMMSGIGAHRAGGRWNAPGTFHPVYCASNPALANREHFASCSRAGLPLHSVMPLMGKAVRVNLSMVLDLRDSGVLKQLGVTTSQLRADRWREATDSGDESLCQAIGRAAFLAGFEGLITPSAEAEKSGDFNIVLVLENAPESSGKWFVLRGGSK
ncbi:RES family NAD+ phosphorylase [Candidatus Sumerlaeota bacterium]|nr:RES family NAD+ phosphorylase [Candidatus Sumerlaeota bacterium]